MNEVARPRILFVDDEPSIRVTLAPLLERYDFTVVAVASVDEVLIEINTRNYDVLISDLNIHTDGDGYLVISAMRHVQPECRNFILTGYPAFESALLAIQHQIDDMFVKPADIETLVSKIRQKLDGKTRTTPPIRRLLDVLKENSPRMTQAILDAMKRDPTLSVVKLSDEQRVDHIPQIFASIVGQLQQGRDLPDPKTLKLGAEHGRRRQGEGYDAPMLIRDFQLTEEAVYDVMQGDFPLSAVGQLSDLRLLKKSLDLLALESLRAFGGANDA